MRLAWRARNEPGYATHVAERFGRYPDPFEKAPVLWLHAVSLGETRAAVPLVERLLRTYPGTTLVLTHMTATGREAGRTLFGERVVQAWLPYDLPFAVRGFLARIRPCAGIIMETELWPNLVAAMRAADRPVFLVNARLSQRSAAGYARVPGLVRPMLAALTGVAAQAQADAQRLEALGAPSPVVTGNLKFDVAIPDAAIALGRELRVRFGESRPVFVAGCTRDGEEAMLLDALARRPLPDNALLVIVPRHPQRFAVVADLLGKRGIPFARRSENAPVPADVRVVLGDSMGEMAAYYVASDVAFVGGGLAPLGGHNLIEAIAAGKPTLVGPHMFNFAEAAANAIAAGAAVEVTDADALIATASELLRDPARRDAMHAAALSFHAAHGGAADRLWRWLAPQLDAAIGVSRAAGG